MKFNRNDIGLYIALGLVGAGTGLLIGAFIAGRRKQSRVSNQIRDLVDETEKLVDNYKLSEDAKETLEEYTIPEIVVYDEKPIEPKSQYSEEIQEFIEEYEPTSVQLEMVMKDILSIDEVKKALDMEAEDAEDAAEHNNYAAMYGNIGTKTPEDEGLIDDRYNIYRSLPSDYLGDKRQTVYYDESDDSFYIMSKQGTPIPMGKIYNLISENLWEIMKPYMVSGWAPLYVVDLETKKQYQFELVLGTSEDSTQIDNSVGK